MLLSDGQGGTVNPLVNLLPLLCLKGIESFPSVTHPKDKVARRARCQEFHSGCVRVCCGCMKVFSERMAMVIWSQYTWVEQ